MIVIIILMSHRILETIVHLSVGLLTDTCSGNAASIKQHLKPNQSISADKTIEWQSDC